MRFQFGPSSMPNINYSFQTLRGDVFGGVTSAIISLPVALAFAIAAGLDPVAGIYGAIAVGFFAAVFGGTRSQISGPTGSMTVAMGVIVTANADNLAVAFTIVIMAGLIQLFIGALRIGRFVEYTPYSVISGFMSGVGIIILLTQTLPFLGAEIATGGPVGAIQAWPDLINHFNPSALIIGAATLAVAVLWPERFSNFLPATLAALVVGILLGVFWLTDAPVIGEVPTGLPDLVTPEISTGTLLRAIQPALVIALVGSADTLLTSLVADSMTGTRHNADRELLGQGIGNVITGFIGGLPGSGATPGTVANIRAGGWTPLSGVLCVAILLAIVMGLGKYVASIPIAVLAGILIKVGWDTIDWRFITRIFHVQRDHLLVMLLTLGLTVFLDLVTAVAVGMIAAGVASAKQYERLELDSVVSVPLLDQVFFGNYDNLDDIDAFSAQVGLVALKGTFSVASASKLINTISVDIQDHEVVILDFSDTVYIDDSAALVVERMINTAMDEDTECIIMGLDGLPEATLRALNILQNVPEDHFAENLDEAREIARTILDRQPEPAA